MFVSIEKLSQWYPGVEIEPDAQVAKMIRLDAGLQISNTPWTPGQMDRLNQSCCPTRAAVSG